MGIYRVAERFLNRRLILIFGRLVPVSYFDFSPNDEAYTDTSDPQTGWHSHIPPLFTFHSVADDEGDEMNAEYFLFYPIQGR